MNRRVFSRCLLALGGLSLAATHVRGVEYKIYASEVTVYGKDGNLVSGRKVCLEFTSLLGGFTDNAYTDSRGRAVIHHASKGEVKVFVDGDWSSHKTRGHAPGSINVYLKK